MDNLVTIDIQLTNNKICKILKKIEKKNLY